MPDFNYDEALRAADYLRPLTGTPSAAIVTGSGLNDIASIIDKPSELDVHDIPGWPLSTAPGHAGKITAGSLAGKHVVILQGRVHYYEGYSLKAVTFPVRVLSMLGVSEYIATNSAGAVNLSYSPGDIIAVKDHINLMGNNPLIGPNEDRWNPRFPDMSHAYNPRMLSILESMGLKLGVYAAMSGPSFETPAEIRMLRILGADLAGMSTVPEVIAANAMGMKVCVLSCVTNMASGIEKDKTHSGQEVIDAAGMFSGKLAGIIREFITRLNEE